MKKCYKKICKLIEASQKRRADEGDTQIPVSYAALHAMRQTKETEGKHE